MSDDVPAEDKVALEEARMKLRWLESCRSRVVDAIANLRGAEIDLTPATRQVAVLNASALVLGRYGVQKRLAEGVMTRIDVGANQSLQTAGIELNVRAVWERETGALATACDACGAAFPKSARVKACERCGANRGPKIANGLRVQISDRSGGAEDLAGIVYQLAAGNWLLARRSSPYEVLILDEPFGSLDPANRRALVTHFSSLLMTSCSQAFVIAHERGIMEAMPKRVAITVEPGGSTIRVVE